MSHSRFEAFIATARMEEQAQFWLWDDICRARDHGRSLQESIEDQKTPVIEEKKMTTMEKKLIWEMRKNRKLETKLLLNEFGDKGQGQNVILTRFEKKQLEELEEAWKLKQELNAVKDCFRKDNLELLPDDWFDDQDICKTVLWKKGYKGLPHKLKCDIRIIKVAFLFYGGQKLLNANVGWEYIPPAAQNDPEVVVAALKQQHCFPSQRKWEAIPAAMQKNTIVAWHAVRMGIRDLADLPFLLETRKTVLVGLNLQCIRWKALPDVYRNDEDLARSVSADSISRDMLQHFPVLRSDRFFWLRFTEAPDSSDWGTFKKYATQSIRSDEDVVLCLLERTPYPSRVFRDADIPLSLWEDADFIAKLNNSPKTVIQRQLLLGLPQEKQKGYLHLVLENIKLNSESWDWKEMEDIAARISPELWLNRRLLETWFKSSHAFIKPVHDALLNDKKVFLLVSEHCRWTNSFNKIGDELLKDKVYLTQVLQLNPRRYTELPRHTRQDCSLATLFYGGSSAYTVERFLDESSGDEPMKKFVEELQADWKTQLETVFILFRDIRSTSINYNGFFQTLDEETGKAIKQSIAHFVGLPEKKLLLTALTNLKKYQEAKRSAAS